MQVDHQLWRRGVVVITTAQLHSTKPELRICAGSNHALGGLEIRDGEDLNKAKRLSSVNHTTKTIHLLHRHHQSKSHSDAFLYRWIDMGAKY